MTLKGRDHEGLSPEISRVLATLHQSISSLRAAVRDLHANATNSAFVRPPIGGVPPEGRKSNLPSHQDMLRKRSGACPAPSTGFPEQAHD